VHYSILTLNEGNFGKAALKPSPNPPRPTESRLKLSLPVSKIEFNRLSCLLPGGTADSFSSGTDSMSSELFCNCSEQKFVMSTKTSHITQSIMNICKCYFTSAIIIITAAAIIITLAILHHLGWYMTE
jgi:hypothetical protein